MGIEDITPPPVVEFAAKPGLRPVRFVYIAPLAFFFPQGLKFHLTGVSEDGRLFERWSDDRPGEWKEIERPER